MPLELVSRGWYNSGMIDSHAHLDDPSFDADRDAVLDRAAGAGLTRIVTIGCDLATSRSAVDLAARHPFLAATVGVHPHESASADEATLREIEALSKQPGVVGWGEIGLDYHYMHAPKGVQQEAFRQQIRLARGRNLPLVIHTREARDDTFRILSEEGAEAIGGVFHCFTGDWPMAQAALEMGFMISVSGIVTFPRAADLHEVVRRVPLNRLMIETDCPYLTPVPYRGKRNEPAHVQYVARRIAELREATPYEEILGQTAENTRRLFRMA